MSDFEIVSRIEGRRKWSAAEKASVLAEIEAEGGRVALVARRHRMSESLLYNWRSARKAALAAAGGSEPSEFLELGVVGGAACERSAALASSGAGVMEIALPSGVRVRVDGFVSEPALGRVLRALRGAS
jgi:transposase